MLVNTDFKGLVVLVLQYSLSINSGYSQMRTSLLRTTNKNQYSAFKIKIVGNTITLFFCVASSSPVLRARVPNLWAPLKFWEGVVRIIPTWLAWEAEPTPKLLLQDVEPNPISPLQKNSRRRHFIKWKVAFSKNLLKLVHQHCFRHWCNK